MPQPQQQGAVVSVKVGPIEVDDEKGLFNEATGDGGITFDYLINHRYEKDHKRYILGLTSPLGFKGASVAFVQMASPTLLWIADWTASSWLRPPFIPNPTLSDPNWIILDEHVEPANVSLAADGTSPFYRISGVYIYGHVSPNARLTANATFPKPAWLDDEFERSLPINLFKQNIISAVGKGHSTKKETNKKGNAL